MNNVSFKQSKPEQSLGFMFWQVTLQWQNTLRRALRPLELTHIQFVLLINLAWLQNQSKNVTQVRLSQQSRVHIMMVSKVCRVLEKKGLIDRHAAQDSRAKNLSLTKTGAAKAQSALKIVEAADDRYFSPLKEGYDLFLKALTLLVREKKSQNTWV